MNATDLGSKPASECFRELGKHLVALGAAIQDDSTPLTELVDLANLCGLRLSVQISVREAQESGHD